MSGRAHSRASRRRRWVSDALSLALAGAVAGGAVLPARAAAQFLWYTNVDYAPLSSPGPNYASIGLTFGGDYGMYGDCSDPSGTCVYTPFDARPAPNSLQFTLNGARQDGLYRVTGTTESCHTNPADFSYRCTTNYNAANPRLALPTNTQFHLVWRLAPPYDWLAQTADMNVGVVDRARPVVSVSSHEGNVRDVSRCAASCFDVVAAVSTPTYTSLDVARGVSLVYRSNRGRGEVTLDATDFSATPAARVGLQLYNTQDGNRITWDNGSTELQFTPAAGRTTRLVGTAGNVGPPTGVLPYEMTAVVTHYWNDGTSLPTEVPVRLIIERQVSSAYGVGWSVAGVRMIRFEQTVNRPKMAVWDGTGSAQIFDADCPYARPFCTFLPPPGVASGPIIELGQTDAWGAHMYQTFPDGSAAGYGGGGHQVYSVDPYGRRTTFQWIDDDHLQSITDPAGQVTQFEYDGASHLAAIVDQHYRRTRVQVDGNGDLVSAWDPLAHQTTFGYTNHALTQYTQPDGGVWNYAYDAAGKVLTVTAPAIQTTAGTQRPVVRMQSAELRVLAGLAAGQGGAGNPMPGTAPGVASALVTDAAGNTVTHLLDRFGSPIYTRWPNGSVDRVGEDAMGFPTQVVEANGHDRRVYYNPLKPWLVDSTWDVTTGQRVRYTYDPGNCDALATVAGDVTPVTNTWSGCLLRSSQTGANGPTTKYGYNTYPNRGLDPRPTTVADQNDHTTTVTFQADAPYNTETVRTPGGTTTYRYDTYGNQIFTRNARGDTTYTEYDVLNRAVSTMDGLGNVTKQEYNALFPTATVDAKGARYQRQGVNAFGAAQGETDPAGATTNYSFDGAGRLWQKTDRRGQLAQFRYDPMGNVTGTYVSDASSPSFWYDPNRHIVVASNAESVDSTFFDNAGRKVREVHNFPALLNARRTGAFDVTSRYDVQGRRDTVLLGAVGRWGLPALRYHYNALGQFDTLVDYAGRVTTLGYNADGALLSRTLPGAIGSIGAMPTAQHVDGGQQFSNGALDAAFGTRLDHDALGRISERVSTQSQQGAGYKFDAAGRLSGTSNVAYRVVNYPADCTPIYGASGVAPTDPNEQPTSYLCPPDTRGEQPVAFFSYDAVGNPTDGGAAYEDDAHRLTNRLSTFNGERYFYDVAGNRWMHTAADGTWRDRPAWNVLGQMKAIQVYSRPDGSFADSVDFGYDALGRRVRKTIVGAGRTTYYVWDGDHVALEVDGNGTAIAAYAYYPGVDQPHSARVAPLSGSDRTYYYVQGDAPSNVLGLVDANANVAATYNVDVWGKPTAINEPGLQGWAQPYLFAGRAYDRETGLYYNRARYYDPVARRFLSEDPAGLVGGINLYAYAGNDPVSYRDPYGLDPCYDVGPAAQGQLAPVQCDTPWPFSTPKSSGASGNFGNPGARGGGLTGPGSGPGGSAAPGGAAPSGPAAPAKPSPSQTPQWMSCASAVAVAGLQVAADASFLTGVGEVWTAGRVFLAAAGRAGWALKFGYVGAEAAASGAGRIAAAGLARAGYGAAAGALAENYTSNAIGSANLGTATSVWDLVPVVASVRAVSSAVDACSR